MRKLSAEIQIDASSRDVWNIMRHVSAWPQWTSTMISVTPCDVGALGVGSRVHIVQPGLRPATWTIQRWEPELSFSWVTSGLGFRILADHSIETMPNGAHVKQSLEFSGFLAPLIHKFLGSLCQSYLKTELQGLKRICESKFNRNVSGSQ